MVVNNSDVLMCLLVFPSLFSLTFLFSAVSHISSLGKSKSYQKKEKQHSSLLQKILLLRNVESCRHYVKTVKRLRNIYWLLIVTILLCLLLCILPNCDVVNWILQYCILAKVVLLDIPVNLYCCFMTRHAKQGGITWKWEI